MRLSTLFLAASSMLATWSAQAAPPAGYTLVWRDEFNQKSWSDDQIQFGTKWTDHLYYRGGNGPLDMPVPWALAIESGKLVMTATAVGNGKYYGATLSSVNENVQGYCRKYGYWEMRAKPAKGYNLLTSMYLVSQPHMVRVASPPDPFEIDAIEYNGGSPTVAATTVHWYLGGNHYYNEGGDKTDTGLDLSTSYHTYGMEWTPTVIRFFFDGRLTKQVATPPDGHVPMGTHVVLYLSSWGGGATAATPRTAKAYVDYVRIYAPPG